MEKKDDIMRPIEQYMAGRNFFSAAKMNYFHYFLKQLTRWTLHPVMRIEGKKPVRIADMGAQTGLWAIDVAEDPMLETDVHAFDVSDKFFPPTPWLPPNVTLHTHDIHNTFPDELLETFDAVQFRLFIMLSEESIRSMVKNTIRLLKPGGYIQWVEHDKTDLKPIVASKEQDTSAVEALIELEKNAFPDYNFRWVNSIAPAMAAEGLEVIIEESIETRASLVTQMHELHLIAFLDVPTGLSEAIDTFKTSYFDALASESAKGVASVDKFRVIIARKII